jgi:hypothetical protein
VSSVPEKTTENIRKPTIEKLFPLLKGENTPKMLRMESVHFAEVGDQRTDEDVLLDFPVLDLCSLQVR